MILGDEWVLVILTGEEKLREVAGYSCVVVKDSGQETQAKWSAAHGEVNTWKTLVP